MIQGIVSQNQAVYKMSDVLFSFLSLSHINRKDPYDLQVHLNKLECREKFISVIQLKL